MDSFVKATGSTLLRIFFGDFFLDVVVLSSVVENEYDGDNHDDDDDDDLVVTLNVVLVSGLSKRAEKSNFRDVKNKTFEIEIILILRLCEGFFLGSSSSIN